MKTGEIQENHDRLTIAMCDAAYVLARAGVEGFLPLFKYADECAGKFDSAKHEENMRNAVRDGGRNLARQFHKVYINHTFFCLFCVFFYISRNLKKKKKNNG